MNKLKLTYFDFDGGRAEPARLALHIGGIAFEDFRFAFQDFQEVSKKTPLNQVPTLHVNDMQVTQSDAITRYAGKLAGLYPADAYQALLCDEIIGALEDINFKIGLTFGLSGDDLKHARENFVKEELRKYLPWLQQQLEAQGDEYFADQRLTIADLKAFVILRWLCSGTLDHIPANLVEEVAPKLKAYMHRIEKVPAIAKYYAARSQT